MERRTCVTERVGMPSTWHLWLKSSGSFKETAMLTFKPSSKEKVKSWPRGRAEISAGRHEEECPDGPCFPMGTGLAHSFLLTSSWDKNLRGSALPRHVVEQAQHGKHSRRPFGQSLQGQVVSTKTDKPSPSLWLHSRSLSSRRQRGERQKASHARASDRLSHSEGRPARSLSLSAELLFAGQVCTLGATVPSSSPLRGHSPPLGDPHILIDGARMAKAFHLSLRQLLEVVRGQLRGGVGRCITGHQPRVVHHHPGCQIHLLANDCQRQRESTC